MIHTACNGVCHGRGPSAWLHTPYFLRAAISEHQQLKLRERCRVRVFFHARVSNLARNDNGMWPYARTYGVTHEHVIQNRNTKGTWEVGRSGCPAPCSLSGPKHLHCGLRTPVVARPHSQGHRCGARSGGLDIEVTRTCCRTCSCTVAPSSRQTRAAAAARSSGPPQE